MPKSRPSRKEVKGIIQSLPGRHYLTNHRHLEMEQKADASNPLYGLELDSSSCRSIIYKEDLACVFFFRHFPNIFVEIFPSCLLPRIDSLSVVKKRKRERERDRERRRRRSLEMASRSLLSGDSSFKGLPTEKPRWMPDEEAVKCFGCLNPFGMFTRKHHCRACGLIFCSGCAQWERSLPRRWGFQGPQRVCLKCFQNIDRHYSSVCSSQFYNVQEINKKRKKKMGVLFQKDSNLISLSLSLKIRFD